MAAVKDSQNPHLIDELEGSFLSCMESLTSQEYFNVQDLEEIKTGMELSLQKFLELARQTEAFFLQKRLILSKQKPEQFVKDETEDLRAELERKDIMIKKHQERLQKWQTMLNSVNKGSFYTSPPQQQMSGPTGGQQYPSHSVPPGPFTGGGGMPGQTHMGLSSSAMSGGQYSQTVQQQSSHMMLPRQGSTPGVHQQQPPPAYPQGPLQFLEQSMSSIGMPRT
ncbi:mediator of RNA polymerase II transcription subunit 28-like [Saccostrea echinata]|uniref:mediator of RNA polymerase II transcription subunit 28-like n=1 Tax=Saccostrea echinata TaxID=191078 RepID=UPI002A7ED745|nr:mediator of RNA polymerase II transcription subunit 28-like [Saccostrea echinata]